MNAVVCTLLAGLSALLLSAGDALAGVTPVPEPTSLALIAAGAAAVAWAKFRKRR